MSLHLSGQRNSVAEWSYRSSGRYEDPFHDLELDVVLTDPTGESLRLPAYWAGGQEWRARFTPSMTGTYNFTTECSDPDNSSLHEQQGVLEVGPYDGENPLLQHGGIRIADGHFEHIDGTPFFWLGDTWWMGGSRRFRWPEDFQLLTEDRKSKGFSVIQVCAAFACGMELFDPRDANEAGWAWEEDFKRINPRYFDLLDLRIAWLARSGLVPCLVGAWGYHLLWLGTDRMKQHWRYLVARYSAYPVVWCLAGETTMPNYSSEDREADGKSQRQGWTEVARHVRTIDPHKRLVTTHPADFANGRDDVDGDDLLDFDMLQATHGGYPDIADATRHLLDAVARVPRMPVVNDEVNYEGVWGGSWQDMQRFLFWSTMLSGAAGFTYGATGIWQFNSRESKFGSFPHGAGWGDTPWEDAYRFPGSRHMGVGRRILERFPWWRLEPHQEWVDAAASRDEVLKIYCAGIPGELRICYMLPAHGAQKPGREGLCLMLGIQSDVRYRASCIDPTSGVEYPLGEVNPRPDGSWPCSYPPEMRDWVIVLTAEGGSEAERS